MIEIIRDFFRNIKYGIENLFVWFLVIWEDRNWDYIFILEILQYKLRQTEKLFRKYGHHVDANADADNMKICIALLDRLIKDEYDVGVFKKYYEKWGESELDFKNTETSNLKKMVISHKNVKTKEDEKNEREDFRKCIKQEEYLKNQDLDLLFKMMRKHIQEWWD